MLAAVLGVFGLGAMFFSITQDLSIFTSILCGVLVVAAIALIFTSLRRGTRLARLAGNPNEPVVRVDQHGITLHGLPTLAWHDVLFVAFLDGREQAAKRRRMPLIGWSSNLAVRAGNASLGGEIGARDAKAWRAACTSPAQGKQIVLGHEFPDGRTPGGAPLFLDIALSEQQSLEVMRVLTAQANAHGIPTDTATSAMKHFEFKGPLLHPTWNK